MPYKQRVTGSNPVTPTKPDRNVGLFHYFTLCLLSTYYIQHREINIMSALVRMLTNDLLSIIPISQGLLEKPVIGLFKGRKSMKTKLMH